MPKSDLRAPTLLFLVGPPAVGKMTVGREVARLTGFRLFHNHQTIDLVLPFFAFGTPPFVRLVGEFRRRIFEEVAASEMPGLIFTYVWAFNDPRDDASVERLAEIFRVRGGRVLFVELQAHLETRLERNETAERLAAKPFMRDTVSSRARLLDLDAKHQLNSGGRFANRADYLHIDNSSLTPAEVARRIVGQFSLKQVPDSNDEERL